MFNVHCSNDTEVKHTHSRALALAIIVFPIRAHTTPYSFSSNRCFDSIYSNLLFT